MTRVSNLGAGQADASSIPADRARLKEHKERAADDASAMLAEGIVAHVGIADADGPVVIPMTYHFDPATPGEIYLHGAHHSRLMQAVASGERVCVTVTMVDALVYSKSGFNHSVNYRSVVVLGEATPVDDRDEKMAALEALTERLLPGRWADVRSPNAKELKATAILRMPLDEISAKVRTGPPEDDEADYSLDVWAGVIPLELVASEPQADPRLATDAGPPVWAPGKRA